jgi:hypothetical protein
VRIRIPVIRHAVIGAIMLAAAACTEGCGHGGGASPPSGPAAPSAPQPAPAPEVAWQKPILVDRGDAYEGPWRMNRSEFHYVDDPTVEIAVDGTIAVAWVDNRRRDVLFRAYDAGGEPLTAEPVDVSRSPEVFSWLPDLVVDGRQVFVLWQEIVFSGGSHGGEIFFARSTDGGRSFGEPLNLSRSREGDGKGRLTRDIWQNGSLDLERGPDGALYAAWTEYEGALWLARSTDGGGSFSEPRQIAGSEEQPARAPDLAVGPEGRVYLAWSVGEVGDADIRLAVSDDGGGSFGAPQVLFASEGHSDAPRIAVDGRGDVHLVYAESPAGRFQPAHILYARLESGRPGPAQPRRIAGPRSGVRSASFPALSLGADGGVFVLWERYPPGARHPRGLGFAFSTDGGATFSPPSLVPGTAASGLGDNGGRQGLLLDKLAVHESGAIAVVNSRFNEGEASRVHLIRGRLAAMNRR